MEDTVVHKVLVLYVGGTIGMQRNEENVYTPKTGAFIAKIREQSTLHDPELAKELCDEITADHLVFRTDGCVIAYKIIESEKLVDSSQMELKDWIKIAKNIKKHYNHYHGFVVLHGTDTLVYAASLLSFMLDGLTKSVILTGSQISIFELRSDARENFLTSLILAGVYRLPEVMILFANKLLRGNRTIKHSCNVLEAFSSPNYPVLAEIGIDIKVNYEYVRRPEHVDFSVRTNLSSNVSVLVLYPTINLQTLNAFFHPNIEGVVIQSFGTGNFPSQRKDLLECLKEKVAQGVIVINITQCQQGAVSITYAAGKVLEDIGVIPGYDMTAEAAFAKLCYVLKLPNLTVAQKRQLMQTNLRGELTNCNNNTLS